MVWTVAWKIVLSGLLIVAAVLDVRSRRVPHLVTWPLLLIAVGVRARAGAWMLPLLLAGLALVELVPEAWRLPFAGLIVALAAGVGDDAAGSRPCGGGSPTPCGRRTSWEGPTCA